MIGRTNAKRGGSGNVTEVTISSGASGQTVTASRTGKSKTATTDANGVATFRNLDMGYNWTFTWGAFSKTEKIDQLNESVYLGLYNIELMYNKVYKYSGQSYHIASIAKTSDVSSMSSSDVFNLMESDPTNPIFVVNIYSDTTNAYVSAGTIELDPEEQYRIFVNVSLDGFALATSAVSSYSDGDTVIVHWGSPSGSKMAMDFTPVNAPTYYLYIDED